MMPAAKVETWKNRKPNHFFKEAITIMNELRKHATRDRPWRQWVSRIYTSPGTSKKHETDQSTVSLWQAVQLKIQRGGQWHELTHTGCHSSTSGIRRYWFSGISSCQGRGKNPYSSP